MTYNLPVSIAELRSKPMRSLVIAVWYFTFALALLVLAVSLPGYVQRVLYLSLEPIDAPEMFVVAVRTFGAFASIGTAALSLALATLLFARKRDDRMSLFLSFYLIGYGIVVGGPVEALAWLDPRWATWGVQTIGALLLAPTLLLLAWFPNGQWVPRWMRYAVIAALLFTPFALFISPSEWYTFSSLLPTVGNFVLLVLIGVGIGAQIYRYRHVSMLMERQQTKWFVFGLVVWITLFVLVTIPYVISLNYPPNVPKPWWTPLSQLVWWLTLMVIPLSLTIAIMRYRLWEIDFILNRAMVFGALTALVIGLYVLIVGGLSVLFQTQTNWLMSLLATGIVAVLFQPLRERVQRAVNRFVYGARDEPYDALGKLGQRLESTLEPDAVLPTIVETVAHTLKLPYAAIVLMTNDERRTAGASFPSTLNRPPSTVVRLPLYYQREALGELVIAPRAGEGKFSDTDTRLLQDFARQAGIAVHAARLTTDLQRSREKLVTAREEERRRIRRDLHDGLGPSLATLLLQLDAARNLLRRDVVATDELLRDLKLQTQSALAEIRRLVYELRPPALDDLGLVGALREQITRYDGVDGLRVTFDAPETVPPLPAAVEVAAYRIAVEALTNVVKHGCAKHCAVQITCGARDLRVEICDDGAGLPHDYRAGVGLTSMRERAAELGGTCVIENAAGGGTRVVAILPAER